MRYFLVLMLFISAFSTAAAQGAGADTGYTTANTLPLTAVVYPSFEEPVSFSLKIGPGERQAFNVPDGCVRIAFSRVVTLHLPGGVIYSIGGHQGERILEFEEPTYNQTLLIECWACGCPGCGGQLTLTCYFE